MGAGKGYSAGAIFLQVVPVFKDVQKHIADEAKNWDAALGDQMEKSGEKAGERAGKAANEKMNEELKKGSKQRESDYEREFKGHVAAINKALEGVDTKRLSNDLRKEFAEVKKDLDALGKTDVFKQSSLDKAEASLHNISADLQRIQDNSNKALGDNFDKANRSALKLHETLDRLKEPIELDVRTEQADRKMSLWRTKFRKSIEQAMKSLEGTSSATINKIQRELDDLHADITLSPGMAEAEMKKLMARLRAEADNAVDIEVRLASLSALAELEAVAAARRRLDGSVARVRVDVNAKGGIAQLFAAKRSADDAANSFRAFNIVLLAAVSIGPALVPVLGAIAGGLLALGPAAAVAGASIGSVLVGFSGIGDVLTALQAKDDAAAKTAATSAKSQEDSANRVADARRSAARAVESALDAQKAAQERYAQSIQDVKDAEEALRQARQAAKGTGADIKERISDNKLAQDQGLVDVFNATVNYNSVMADGSSTNLDKEQARIQLEQAKDALSDLRREAKELAKEKAKWDKEGVNGTEEVQNAQDNLNAAIDAQKDAYRDLGDAAKAVDQARADGARQVAEAMRGQAEAMDAVNTQQANLDAAMNKLGPAGRKFALFLYGLRKGFYEFRDDVQSVLLPQIQEAISSFLGSSNASVLRKALINLAAGFGAFAVALSTSFQGEAWGGFFQMLADLGPEIQAAYGQAFIYFLEALASILTTLAPYALDFAKGFEALMKALAGWSGSEAGATAIQQFMAYVEQVAPSVLNFFEVFASALANVLTALAPYGQIVLEILTSILDYIAKMDTETLGNIVGALLVMVTASQAVYAVTSGLKSISLLLASPLAVLVFLWTAVAYALYIAYTRGGTTAKVLATLAAAAVGVATAIVIYTKAMALGRAIALGFAAASYGAAGATYAQTAAQKAGLVIGRAFIAVQAGINAVMAANPIALLVLAIVGLVVALVILYRKNEAFRDFVQAAWAKIKEAFWAAWEVIKVVLEAIGDAFAWLWHNAISPALHWIGDAFGSTFRAMKKVWLNVLWPVFKTIAKVVWNLYKAYFKVVFVLIKALFKATFIAMKWIWQHVLKPVFSAIGVVLGWLWENVFKPRLDSIKEKFDLVFRGMKWVWEHVLKPVFDYIGDKALPKLKGAFDTAVDAIKDIWDGLKKVVGAPIKFVLDTIINKGLIAGFNKVAGWVGEDGFDPIPIPKSLQQYATGGIMPGYTPGRDVHAFYSPTAGRLELSGGEAVMRPEWTAAMGSGYVNQMNAIARSKGVKGVRQAMGMGGYWMGGVLPFPGASVSSHGSMYGHPAFDLNYPGYADYGQHVGAWKAGTVAQMNYIGDDSYGRWVVLNHTAGSSLYAHLSAFAEGLKVGAKVAAGQWIGNVGDLGNTGTPPTSHLHFEIMGGIADMGDTSTGGGGRSVPGFIKDLLLHPLDTVKGWATAGWDKASDTLKSFPMYDTLTGIPKSLVSGFGDKAWDMVPGWAKDTIGVVGNFAGAVKDGLGAVKDGVGGVISGGLDAIGLAEGGILPYNGTMMYDNGGYLPPGLTTVVNLTGKPEPVFTADQWAGMESGGQGGNIHYEPHFNGSNLTSEDVAGDLNFTFRRIRRAGKYAGVGEQ